jgi:phosphonate transport system ATP-binding protein
MSCGEALVLCDAARSFGRLAALRGVDASVCEGARVAVIGPSGAGKSTLLRLAAGSLFASSGSVRVLGQDPSSLSPRRLRTLRSRVGVVYQQLLLVPQASVLENVLLGRVGTRGVLSLALAALRRRERDRVAELLARVGIDSRLDERVDRLSGGEQQRVAVARVLWQEPELLLADEPFSSVDPERSAAVLALLLEAARGRTLLLSTHQLDPVLPHFDRFLGLREGRLVFDLPREGVTPERLAALYRTGPSRIEAP